MTYEQPKFIDGTYEQAKAAGYDCLQLKYDGWWCRADCHLAQVDYFSETGREFRNDPCDSALAGCVFVGEYMRGTQWSQHPDRHGKFFVYDEVSATVPLSYRERYKYMFLNYWGKEPASWELVTNFHIDAFSHVWDQYVVNGEFEGVVFKKTNGLPDQPLMRQKKTITRDGHAVNFLPGQGKHTGRLGALEVLLDNGATVAVGSGFTDAEREHIWQHIEQYRGRVCEIEAYAEFESGSLRHPTFIRWRDDKSL